MPVREMLGRLTARELALWQAYYRIDPWGGKRIDMNAAMLAGWIIHMSKAKGPDVDPEKLMLQFGEPARKRQTPEQMAAALNAHVARSGKAR